MSSVGLLETKDELTFESDAYKIKALGVVWRPMPNSLNLQVKLASKTPKIKQEILSEVTKLFDNPGYLAQVIINFICFKHNLWKIKLSWDQTLPLQSWKNGLLFVKGFLQLIIFAIDHCFSQKKEGTAQ